MSPRWLLLHGFTGTPASFARTLAQAPKLGAALYPSILGHDRSASQLSEGVRGLSQTAAESAHFRAFRAEVDALANWVRSLPAGSVAPALCGYSLGARLGLSLAAQHPGLLSRLVLIGAHPGLEEPAARSERRRRDWQLARDLEQLGLEAFVDRWERLPLWASQARLPASLLGEQRAARLTHHPAGLAASLRRLGLGAMPPLSGALRGLETPIDWMVGSDDAAFVAHAQRVEAPHLRRWIIAEAGHNLLLEAPEAVARVLSKEPSR